MPQPDNSLIVEFNARRSEDAFAALVRQHVNLVFATALRQVGKAGAAEEITQNVFVALAQAAGKLGSHPTIAGWLHRTALNKSREWLRGELRRRKREQIAVNLDLARAEGDSVWSPLVPLLDEALLELREPDRQAVILHFMEGRTFQEVGSALGVGEDAARKRVDRCLGQLTHFFRRHGFATPALAVGAPLFTFSSHMAPAGLAASATSAGMAAAHTAASSSTLTLIKGALKIMAWTKAKTAVVAVAAAVLAAGTTTVAIKVIHPSVGKFTVADLDANIAKLNHPGATVKEVVQVLGRPQKYMWNNKTIDPDNPLNTTYIMVYPQSVMVEVSHSLVVELRSEGNGRGFIWQGGLRLGSSLDEALQVLGPPSSSVVGKPLDFTDGVLYKDIEGQRGNGYYARADQKIRLFFSDDKVVALYVVVNPMK